MHVIGRWWREIERMRVVKWCWSICWILNITSGLNNPLLFSLCLFIHFSIFISSSIFWINSFLDYVFSEIVLSLFFMFDIWSSNQILCCQLRCDLKLYNAKSSKINQNKFNPNIKLQCFQMYFFFKKH